MSHHCHHHGPKKLTGIFAISIVVNLLYTIVQVIYAYSANSSSLLADAGHNFGDVLSLMMAWVAHYLLTKPATERLSYGYRRSTILVSMINAMILLVTCGIILREAIEKFLLLSQMDPVPVMVVAFVGILVNGGTALLFLRDSKEDLNLKAAFLHLAYDALISLGVVISAALIYFTHLQIIDPIVGTLIALLIIKGAWALTKETLNLAMDGVPKDIDLQAVQTFLLSIDGVETIHDLHIWALSTRENALTAHLVMPTKQLTDSKRKCLNETLKKQFAIHHTTIQVETGKEIVCGNHQACN